MPEGESLAAFAATGATLAIHLAVHAIDRIVAELTPILGAACPVAVVVRATWPQERTILGTLGDIAARLASEPVERTAVILVGRALAAEDFKESALYDPAYRRRFRSDATRDAAADAHASGDPETSGSHASDERAGFPLARK
jgi:precorrin-4/cobalt-precorrin-4 C11-methyltransferase